MNAALRAGVTDSDHVIGSADAPITLVEYGDYECPHCARAQPMVESIREQLGDRLRFVFRHFPLTQMHPHALHAAEAAESVAVQVGDDAFWPMHQALFSNQHALGDDALVRYAVNAGADAERTASDLASDEYEERVQSDFSGGVRGGVNGTPTFFINGERFDGDWGDEQAFLEALRESAG